MMPAVAAAQAPTNKTITVSLSVDTCVHVNNAEVRRLFRLELATSLPNASVGDGVGATQVTARCKSGKVELQVIDPLTAKVLVRRIELGNKGRERLLALAVMELLVASWVELAATPQPKVPVGDPAADAARKKTSALLRKRLAPEPWDISTSVRGSVSLGSVGFSAGGALSVSLDAPSGYGWGVDVVVERAGDSVALGEVKVSAFAAAVSAHLHRRWRAARWRAGGGVRVGGVTMSGKPGEPGVVGRSLTGLAAGPFVRGAVTRPLGKVLVELWLESGYHMVGVHGLVNGAEETSVEGMWMSAQLGVGWQW